jgi:penicillin-binding protein 1A
LETYNSVLNEQIVLTKSEKILNDNASFFKEEVRREIISKFNESKLYDGGLTIMTTLDEDLQLKAEESFRSGLKSYSFRKGWHGPVINFNSEDKKELFEKFKEPEGIYDDELGLVLKVKNDHVTLINKEKKQIKLFKNQMSLIRKKKK